MSADKRTQAPSETRTKLLKIAAKVARREYMPSLENCRTISDARAEVRRMDDLHAQLAWELKTVLDALAGTQAQAAQWISVKEKLPEPQIWIIGCCSHDGKNVVSPVYGRMVGTPPKFRWESEFTVTHWQPLPVAPVAALERKETNGNPK